MTEEPGPSLGPTRRAEESGRMDSASCNDAIPYVLRVFTAMISLRPIGESDMTRRQIAELFIQLVRIYRSPVGPNTIICINNPERKHSAFIEEKLCISFLKCINCFYSQSPRTLQTIETYLACWSAGKPNQFIACCVVKFSFSLIILIVSIRE